MYLAPSAEAVTDVAAAFFCSAGDPACDGGVTMRSGPIARETRALQVGTPTSDRDSVRDRDRSRGRDSGRSRTRGQRATPGVPGTQLCRHDHPATRRAPHNYATWHSTGSAYRVGCPGSDGGRRSLEQRGRELSGSIDRPRCSSDAGTPKAAQKAGDEGSVSVTVAVAVAVAVTVAVTAAESATETVAESVAGAATETAVPAWSPPGCSLRLCFVAVQPCDGAM